MEVQQQSQNRKSVSILTAIVLMLVAFGGGVMVGLHPLWMPASSSPQQLMAPGGELTVIPSGGHPLVEKMPSTMPSSMPSK